MPSGKPPKNLRADPLDGAELDAARGTLREALSALRNFAELLHSVRVGSKALISVLPDVAAGCAPMRATVEGMLDAVAARPELAAASSELQAYFVPRLAILDRELAAAGDKPLSAKSRLGLEQVITQLSLELDTARGLLDLLADAVSNRSLRLDLAELVHQSFSGPPSGGSWNREHIPATLSFVEAGVEVELNPRIVTALFALGVELVARGGAGTPHVSVQREPDGGHQVKIERRNVPSADDLTLIARGVIDPTLSCLQAVARISSVSLAWDVNTSSLSFALPERGQPECNDQPG